MKVLAGLVSPKASVLHLQMATSSQIPHTAFSPCAGTPGVSSSSYKDTSHTGLGPDPVASFNLHYLPKVLSPNTVTW